MYAARCCSHWRFGSVLAFWNHPGPWRPTESGFSRAGAKIHIHELSSKVRWKEKTFNPFAMKKTMFTSFTSYVGKPVFFFCTSCLNWIDGPLVHQLLQARSWRLRRQRFRAAELRSAQLSRESGNAASRGEIDPRYQWKMESNSNSGRKIEGKNFHSHIDRYQSMVLVI